MIGYVTLGSNDLPKALAFYDELFSFIGISRFMEEPDHFLAWAPTPEAPSLAVTKPLDGKKATVGDHRPTPTIG